MAVKIEPHHQAQDPLDDKFISGYYALGLLA